MNSVKESNVSTNVSNLSQLVRGRNAATPVVEMKYALQSLPAKQLKHLLRSNRRESKQISSMADKSRAFLRDVLSKKKDIITEKKVGDKILLSKESVVDPESLAFARHFFRTSNQTLYKAKLRGGRLLTSSAGGVISDTFTLDPNAGTAQDWSSYAAIFDMFRVVGQKVTVVTRPGSAIGGTATDYFGGWYYIAADANSTPTPAIATALDYDNCKLVGNYPSKAVYKFDVPRLHLLDFSLTSAPSGTLGAAFLYGENWSPSAATAEVMVEWDIEFMMVGV